MCNTASRGPMRDRATSTRTLGEDPGVLGLTTIAGSEVRPRPWGRPQDGFRHTRGRGLARRPWGRDALPGGLDDAGELAVQRHLAEAHP